MSNYGLKSSQKGSDVFTAGVSQLRSLSTKNSLKIYKWGTTAQQSLSGDRATVTINHGLGYAPCVWVFANISGSYYPLGNDSITGAFAYADENNLYIEAYNAYGKLTVLPPCKYYIFVDKAQEFNSLSNKTTTGNYGLKASGNEINVEEANEYDLFTSSKFKSLQYFSENIKTETLTLPVMFASYGDQSQDEYQYVDINHGLGYPPAFIAWFYTGSVYKEIPYAEYDYVLGSDLITQDYFTYYQVDAFCDSTKIRITFKRVANFDYYQWISDSGWQVNSQYSLNHSAQTITVRVLPFAENLTGLNYGE